MPEDSSPQPFNYFNYFTEIEERFQQARGTALFLMSPLDWALVETWKEQGIPLEAVLRGIDDAFEKWHKKKSKTSQVNSLAYCAQAVMEAARRLQEPQGAAPQAEALISLETLQQRLREAAGGVPASLTTVREALRELEAGAEDWLQRPEELEQQLTALSDKLLAYLITQTSEDTLAAMRGQLAVQLKPYRSKLSAGEMMLLEKKFLDRLLLEHHNAPRLSLFYWAA
jgi:hypothetical protein